MSAPAARPPAEASPPSRGLPRPLGTGRLGLPKGSPSLCLHSGGLRPGLRGLAQSRALVLILWLGLGALASPAAEAQTPSVPRLYVLADTVHVGEPFGVALAVDRPAGSQVLFPSVPAGSPERGPLLTLGEAEILGARRFPPQLRGRLRTDSLVFEAVTFALDSARVGPVEVRLVTGGDTLRVWSGVGALTVRALAPTGEASPAPPLPPEPFPSARPWWIALGALILGLAAWGVFAWRRGRRRASALPRLAPYPEAEARLDALEAQSPPPDPAAWYAALADALRVYTERRLGLPATTVTTDELDAAFADRLGENARASVRAALRQADLVKFARLRPPPDEAAEALGLAREALRLAEADTAEAEAEAARAAAEASKASPTAPAPLTPTDAP